MSAITQWINKFGIHTWGTHTHTHTSLAYAFTREFHKQGITKKYIIR
jgi:hypothetical protein